jgi:REP element-mobilizing transposase RayT
MLDQSHDKYNWSLITINFHPTDTDCFENFLETVYKPYIKNFPLYINTIEYPDTPNQHLHTVIARPKTLDNAKVLQKLTGKRFTKNLKLNNTNIKNAIDCQTLSTVSDIYQSIGYCVKQREKILFTNIPDEDLEVCYKSYIYASKDVICKVDHALEYKSVSKGDLLLYLYDAAKKFPDIPIPELPAYMVAKLNFSFIPVKSLLNYALLELRLKLKPELIESINLQEELNEHQGGYSELSKQELIKLCEKQQHRIDELEMAFNFHKINI